MGGDCRWSDGDARNSMVRGKNGRCMAYMRNTRHMSMQHIIACMHNMCTYTHTQQTYSAHAIGPSGVCTTNGCLYVGCNIVYIINLTKQHPFHNTLQNKHHPKHRSNINTPSAVRWVYDLQAFKSQKVASIGAGPYTAIIGTTVPNLEGRCHHFLPVFKWAAHQSQCCKDTAHSCLLLANYKLAKVYGAICRNQIWFWCMDRSSLHALSGWCRLLCVRIVLCCWV